LETETVMTPLATTLLYERAAIFDGSSTVYSPGTVASGIGLIGSIRRIPRDAGGATVKQLPLQWGERFAKLFEKLDILEHNESLTPAEAPAPNHLAVGLARLILARFHEIETTPDKIVATADGGVTICFIDGNKYSDIECSNEGGLLGVTTNRRDRPVVWEINH
jgi:hypothetical protein